MLQAVQSHHFQTLLGQTVALRLPDGSELPVQIEHLEDSPGARMRNSERMPFSVELNSLVPTDFVNGPCMLQLPELGEVENIFVSRVPSMGRDPQRCYFYIAFN